MAKHVLYLFVALIGISIRMKDLLERQKREKIGDKKTTTTETKANNNNKKNTKLNPERFSRKSKLKEFFLTHMRRLDAIVLLDVGLNGIQNRKSTSSKKTWPNNSY